MAREISISFALTAALKGGFKSAFQSAASSARGVTSAIREMEKSSTGKLGASINSQREKIRGLAGSLKEAKSTLASLNAQAAAGGTRMLARQIELAENRVKNLSGALGRSLDQWKKTGAEAATVGGSLRRLAHEYEQLSQKMERARKIQGAMNANRAQGDALRAQRSDLNSRLTGMAATAMTVGAPAMLAIGFEDQMAKVGAVSRASKEDLAALTAQARQLGRDTVFSASQAGEGMQYLAMAGFRTNQIMGAMPGMLDLAAASGTDLGRTADIASNILSAFEMKAEDMGRVGDVLTAAFTSSNTTLESLGETMKYVAPVAKDAGASLEEATALAAVLGNVGISGSQAGTSAKAIYARLSAPPTEAADALNALSIATKDAQGNLRKVPDILEEIIGKTRTMGNADRAGIFKDIFGLESMAAASSLAKQAAKTIDEAGNQIVDNAGKPTTALLKIIDDLKHATGDATKGTLGASKQVAEKMNATTGGALRRLKSAWEDAGISVGNLFLPAIQTAANALSGMSNVISGAIQRFPNLSRGIALVAGGVLAFSVAGVGLGLVMNLVRTSINGWRGALLRLSASQITATASTGAMSAASFLFGAASRVAGAGARFFAGGLRSILLATGVGALLVGLGYGISLLIDNWDAVVGTMSAAWSWVTDTWGRLGVFFSELGNNLATVWPEIKADLCLAFDEAWNGICGLAASWLKWITDLWRGIGRLFSPIWEGIVAGASWLGQGVASIFSWARDSAVGVWQGITGFFSSLWAGISEGASWIWEGITSIASWAFEWICATWSGITEFFSPIWAIISDAASWLWQTVTGVAVWAFNGISGIWSGITGFFSGIWSYVSQTVANAWQAIVGFAAWAFDGVGGIWNGAVSFFSGIVDGISRIFSGFFSWVKEKFAWVLKVTDAIGSVIGKITGAVKDAKATAFDGDKDSPAKSAETAANSPAAPSALSALEKPAAPEAVKVPEMPAASVTAPQKYKPVSASDYYTAKDSKKGKSGAGGSKTKSSGGSKSPEAGPVTIVSVAGDNSTTQTVFIPASRYGQNSAQNARQSMGQNAAQIAAGRSGSVQMPASRQAATTARVPRVLPQSPELIRQKTGRMRNGGEDSPTSINIDLKQNFDLITQDAAAVRKIMESLKPDFEALVRKALEKISSDRRRTAYAQ